MLTPPNAVFAFAVWTVGRDDSHPVVVNARNRSTAKYGCWLSWSDTDERLRIVDMRARKVGPPVTSEDHRRVMRMRACPHYVAGARVLALGQPGVVVGANSSANFDVLLDGHKHALNYHPTDLVLETPC